MNWRPFLSKASLLIPGGMKRTLLFPAIVRLTGIQKDIAEYDKMQWLSTEDIKCIQLRKLKSLLQHSYDHVPFYKKMFDRIGLRPGDITSFDDFSTLPTIGRKSINENIDQMIADDCDLSALTPKRTSGSTGEQLRLFVDRAYFVRNTIHRYRFREWAGINAGQRIVSIGGVPLNTPKQGGNPGRTSSSVILSSMVEKLLYHQVSFNSYAMGLDCVATYYNAIRDFKPQLIAGYTSAIYFLARFIAANDLPAINPAAVRVGAETLFPHQRALIESTFGTRVYNNYASIEIGQIANECEHGNMHIVEDVYLEFGKEVDKDQYGRSYCPIVLTSLNSYSMPIIRYEIGDVGIPSTDTCPCGRGLPLITEVTGRVYDVIKLADGRNIYAGAFSKLIWQFEGIQKFRVVQKRLNEIDIYLQTSSLFGDDQRRRFEYEIQNLVGKLTVVKCHLGVDLHAEGSGKYRFVVSEAMD